MKSRGPWQTHFWVFSHHALNQTYVALSHKCYNAASNREIRRSCQSSPIPKACWLVAVFPNFSLCPLVALWYITKSLFDLFCARFCGFYIYILWHPSCHHPSQPHGLKQHKQIHHSLSYDSWGAQPRQLRRGMKFYDS